MSLRDQTNSETRLRARLQLRHGIEVLDELEIDVNQLYAALTASGANWTWHVTAPGNPTVRAVLMIRRGVG